MGSTRENILPPLLLVPPADTTIVHLCEALHPGVSSPVEKAGSPRVPGMGCSWSRLHIVMNPVQVISNLGIYARYVFLPTAESPADDTHQRHVLSLHAHQGAARVTLRERTVWFAKMADSLGET